jgi:WD repeat-containing protein 1 (actin-interacting protein 1)
VHDVAFSPDGKHLVSVGADAKIVLYDGKSGEKTGVLEGDAHKGSIFAVGWDKQSSRVVTASADQTVKLWDVETGKVVESWKFGHGISIPHQQLGVVFTTSSAAPIVSLSLSGDLIYLDPSSARPIRTLHGHQKPINALAATPDYKTIFSGSYDGRVCAWDVASGTADVVSETGGGVVQFAAADNTTWSISQDDVLKDIDVSKLSLGGTSATGSTPRGVSAQDSETVFLATITDIQVLQRGRKLVQEKPKFVPSAIAANPVVKGEFAVGSEDTKVYIYTHAGSALKLKATLTSSRSGITALAYNPQGTFLAVGDSSGKIVLYTVSGGETTLKTSRWAFHVSRITSLAFNATGTRCVSGSLDTNVYVWSTESVGKYVAIKGAAKDGVWGVAWVGEERVVSAGGDGALKVWEIESK